MISEIEGMSFNVVNIIRNHPNYIMVKSVDTWYDKDAFTVKGTITLRNEFYFDSNHKEKYNYSFDFKYGYDESVVSKRIYELLNMAHVKDDYLYYDSDKEMSLDDINKNRELLAVKFFGKEFDKLSNQERNVVLQFAGKDKYKSVTAFKDAFASFYIKNNRLPYDYEPLGIARKKAVEYGFLSESANYLIAALTTSGLFNFINNNNRLPKEDEEAYEKHYLPVVKDYRDGKYCPSYNIAIDMVHLKYTGSTLGDLMFKDTIDQLNNSYGLDIDIKKCRIQYYMFDSLGAATAKYRYYNCYRKKIWFFDDNNELKSHDLLIVYKGDEHYITRDAFKKTIGSCIRLKDKIDKFDNMFNQYVAGHNRFVLVIRQKDLIAGPDAICKMIFSKVHEFNKEYSKITYNSEAAAHRALKLKELHNID